MDMKRAGLAVLAGIGALLGGCVYVPPTPSSPGYYAPVAAVPPAYVAPAPLYPAPVYVAPRPYYSPYYRPYYRY